MSFTLIVDDLEQLPKIVKEFLKRTSPHKKFVFYAEMGVGKTTLIKEICKELGSDDSISSPTFSIVNEYITLNNDTIYHFDFYRIEDIEEAYNFGIEDYFASNHWLFISSNGGLSAGRKNSEFSLFPYYTDDKITEMYDTNWIDGVFDGGHFSSSEYTIPNFVDTIFQAGSVGLTFSQPHGLTVGDLITIDKTDKTINQYMLRHLVFYRNSLKTFNFIDSAIIVFSIKLNLSKIYLPKPICNNY